MKKYMKTFFKLFIIATIAFLITGCQSETGEVGTIDADIKDIDLYSALPEVDQYVSHYYLHDVYNDLLSISKRDYLRDEWGVYNTITTDVYMYDIEDGTASKIDIQIPENGLVLSVIEVQNDLYFYIMSVLDDSGEETLYYLDNGDNSNLIFQTSEQSFDPSVVVDGDDIYFAVGDTRYTDVLTSKGYVRYQGLKICKLTQDLEIETIFETNDGLSVFFFDDSDPICFAVVNENDDMIFYVYEDGEIKEYLVDDDLDGIAAFGGNVYGIHDDRGEEDRELYWYDIRNDEKVPMDRRAEAHGSLGDHEIVIDNDGVTIMKNVNGEIISYDVEEGLEDALSVVKIDDSSAFIRCRDNVVKLVYLT